MAAAAAIGLTVSALASQPEEKAPEGPRPPPEVEKLAYFVGPWTSEGELKPGLMGPGGPTQGRDICRWMPGKFFLGCMTQRKGPLGLMQVEGILGYDAEKKVYRWWSFDNLGRAETATGTLKDGAWTWSGESKMGDKTVRTRYTIFDTKPDGYAFEWESSPDGKTWTSLMAGKVSRIVPKPLPTGVPGAKAPTPQATPEKKN